ncbi:MAG: hypothetical protein V4510_07640 [bacterium]
MSEASRPQRIGRDAAGSAAESLRLGLPGRGVIANNLLKGA